MKTPRILLLVLVNLALFTSVISFFSFRNVKDAEDRFHAEVSPVQNPLILNDVHALVKEHLTGPLNSQNEIYNVKVERTLAMRSGPRHTVKVNLYVYQTKVFGEDEDQPGLYLGELLINNSNTGEKTTHHLKIAPAEDSVEVDLAGTFVSAAEWLEWYKDELTPKG